IAVHVGEAGGGPCRRELGVEDELGDQEFFGVKGRTIEALAGRALRVHPGRREGGNRQTVLDSVCVERLVADGAYDLALDVTPDLRVRRVHHAEATAVHIEARADAAQDVYLEGRQGEARRVAAGGPDATGRVPLHLAPWDPRAGRVRVPARDAGRVAAAGGRVFGGHRKHGLDRSRGEGKRLAVRDRERGLDARLLPRTTMGGVGAHRLAPGAVAGTES